MECFQEWWVRECMSGLVFPSFFFFLPLFIPLSPDKIFLLCPLLPVLFEMKWNGKQRMSLEKINHSNFIPFLSSHHFHLFCFEPFTTLSECRGRIEKQAQRRLEKEVSLSLSSSLSDRSGNNSNMIHWKPIMPIILLFLVLHHLLFSSFSFQSSFSFLFQSIEWMKIRFSKLEKRSLFSLFHERITKEAYKRK